MISDEFLEQLRVASKEVAVGQGSIEYQMNLACWLGERAHRMIAEIDRLKADKAAPRMDPTVQAITCVAYAIRDAARKARDSRLQKDDDELDSLIRLFNVPEDQLFAKAVEFFDSQSAKEPTS